MRDETAAARAATRAHACVHAAVASRVPCTIRVRNALGIRSDIHDGERRAPDCARVCAAICRNVIRDASVTPQTPPLDLRRRRLRRLLFSPYQPFGPRGVAG
jgi:hypothetical protein